MGYISHEVRGGSVGAHRAGGGCRSISGVQLGSSCVAVLGRCAWRDEGEDMHDEELANQRICNGNAGMAESWF